MQKTVVSIRAFKQALPLIRKFVVAIGIGLTLASLRLDILKQWERVGGTFWSNSAARAVLIALIVACAGLLIANVIRDEGDRFLPSVSGIGMILLGYFVFLPVAVGFAHRGDIGLGPKLGVLGSALIVLGALPLRALGSWQRSREKLERRLLLTWLLAAVGFGLVISSLWRHAASTPITSPNSVGFVGKLPTYWTSIGATGGHTLGIFMISIAIVGIVLALGDAILRAPVLGRWALAASLLLFGLAVFYPITFLAFHRLGDLGAGSGLALEGGTLAIVASLAAIAVERGTVDLRTLSMPKLVAVGGLALTLAATFAPVWRGADSSPYWVDGTLGGLPFGLIVLGGLLLAASFLFRLRWLLPSVSILGWLLAGYFGTYVIQAAPNNLGKLGPAAWLGMSGGALMGLSAVSLRSMAAWKRRSPSMALRQLVPWLATGIGAAILLSSLGLATEAQPTGTKISDTYWNSAGDRSLGIVMLVLGVSTLVALLGVLITRLSVLRTWALAASLVLLGITLFIPTLEAFKHLGTLRSGAWLALVGSLLASAGAIAMTLPDLLLAQAEPEEAEKVVASRTRTPLKGKKRRVPEMRRGR